MRPDAEGFLVKKEHGDKLLAIIPLTFGRARITIGTNWEMYDDGW
jgi:hypothetical protein